MLLPIRNPHFAFRIRVRSDLKRVRINQLPCALPSELLRAEAVRRAEVVAPRGVNQACVDLRRSALEQANVRHPVEQVARLAGFHLPTFERVVIEQMIEARLLDLDAARVGRALENLDVSRRAWRLDARTVAHA